jgi:DNA transposition AAA+ family ATPase
MTNEQKSQIQTALRNYCNRFKSQTAAVNTLNNVSAATVSQILNSNWDNIADNMWRKIGKQIGVSDSIWAYADTEVSRLLNSLFGDAQRNGNVYGIVVNAGGGKSFFTEHYCKDNPTAYHVTCSEFFNRKSFLSQVLKVMGKDHSGSVDDMMDSIISYLEQDDDPLLILDEADKLNDQTFHFFITLYNALEGRCGIIIMATDYLKKRVDSGVKHNKRGYAEIYSRLGGRFIEIGKPKKKDIAAICTANGVTDEETIMSIINQCDGDLRRVKRLVYRDKMVREHK